MNLSYEQQNSPWKLILVKTLIKALFSGASNQDIFLAEACKLFEVSSKVMTCGATKTDSIVRTDNVYSVETPENEVLWESEHRNNVCYFLSYG